MMVIARRDSDTSMPRPRVDNSLNRFTHVKRHQTTPNLILCC